MPLNHQFTFPGIPFPPPILGGWGGEKPKTKTYSCNFTLILKVCILPQVIYHIYVKLLITSVLITFSLNLRQQNAAKLRGLEHINVMQEK